MDKRQFQIRHPVAFLLVLVSLGGCAGNQLSVTYNSDPLGAALYQGSRRFGFTPTSLVYQITDEDKRRGFKILQGTTVYWASGASIGLSSLFADLSKGSSQQYLFVRPENYPNREIDVQFALDLQRLAAMEAQTRAERQAREWDQARAAMKAVADNLRGYPHERQVPHQDSYYQRQLGGENNQRYLHRDGSYSNTSSPPSTSVVPNGYGLGVNRDAYGRPHVYRTQDGTLLDPIFEDGVKRDFYGPGVHQDQFGRPVYDSVP